MERRLSGTPRLIAIRNSQVGRVEVWLMPDGELRRVKGRLRVDPDGEIITTTPRAPSRQSPKTSEPLQRRQSRACARCAEPFLPTANPGQLACSRRCANALNRARRKAQSAAPNLR